MAITVLEQKWRDLAFECSPEQALLLDSPELRLITSMLLNPVTLLPTPQVDSDPILHDYLQMINLEFLSRLDLKDSPLSHPNLEFFVDGSSLILNGQ